MARKGENIFKRKDGRWEGRYIKDRQEGKAIYGFVFGKSYLEVKKKKVAAIATLAEKTKKETLKNDQPIMRYVGSQWLDELKPIRKKSTWVKYDNQLNSHIFPVLGDKQINEISNEDLISFVNGLLTGDNRHGQCLSPKSVSDIFSRIKSIRKFALIHGYEVKFMPDCVKIPQKSQELRVLTFSEEKTLVCYLKKNLDLTSLGILICLFTGIRIGELCALTWKDISLTEKQIHISRTIQRLQNKDKNAKTKTYIEIDEPKSKCSLRTIPIPESIMDALQSAYMENDEYLLTGKNRLFIEPRTMENRFKSILKKCNIADANFHALRHTFATRCIEVGFDIKSLSEILGHANVNITLNRYVHPTMQMKRDNMDKLSGLFTVK